MNSLHEEAELMKELATAPGGYVDIGLFSTMAPAAALTPQRRLKNLSSQVAFEAYARLTVDQVALIHTDPAAFHEALDEKAREILARFNP